MSEFETLFISFMISSLVSLILFYVSIWPVVFRFIIIPFLIGIFFLFLYFLCHQLGMTDWFGTLLSKVGFALGGRALSLLMIKGGCPISVTLAIGFAVNAFLTSVVEPKNMMSPSGGEGPVGGSPGWTSILRSSSTGSSEPSVNQPTPSSPEQPAPDSPPPVAPAGPLDDYIPLQEDGDRRQELSDRVDINNWSRLHTMDMEVRESIIETQLQIERKIEQALRSDGYSEESLLTKRHQIRGFLFYPRGRAFRQSAYALYLEEMREHGTRESVPFRRIMKAIQNYDLLLER